MKKIQVFLLMMFTSINIYSFGGGHDSLLFDGSVNYELPKNADCKIKITAVNKVEIKTYKLVKSTSCGEVFTDKTEVTNVVDKEMEVPPGSDIITGPDGFARVELWDGSVLLISPNSVVKIDADFCDKYGLKLLKGTIYKKIKKILGGGGYEVSTERAAIGVRGTEFEVTIENDITIVKVYESKVEVTPIMNDGSNKLVIKAYEKLIEDMQSGKITAEEYSNKIIKMNEIMEGSRKFPSVMVEAGKMVEVTFEVSEVKDIPADNDKWFEDQKFNK